MPLDPTLVGGIADMVVNPVLQHLTNVQNRKFTREMYGRQRQDSLNDWQMQNAYNSPAEQMKRFKEAGLNPHLIYGQGNEATPVRSSSSSGGQAEAPKSNISGSMMAMYAMKQTQLQSDNLREVNENLKVDRDLKKANIANIISKTDLTDANKQNLMFDLGLKTDLKETTIEGKKLDNQQKQTQIKVSLDANDRAAAANASSIKEATERILKSRADRTKIPYEKSQMQQQINLLKKENIIKQFDVDLTKKNIRPGDPVWWRMIEDVISQLRERFFQIPQGAHGQEPGETLEEFRRRKSIGKHH